MSPLPQEDAEWGGTELIFDLEDKDGQTILCNTHGNWAASTDFLATCYDHWGQYMRSIKLYCETGRGIPCGTE